MRFATDLTTCIAVFSAIPAEYSFSLYERRGHHLQRSLVILLVGYFKSLLIIAGGLNATWSMYH